MSERFENKLLDAPAQDEHRLQEVHAANPLQAALASGATFGVAAATQVPAAFFDTGCTHHPDGQVRFNGRSQFRSKNRDDC